MYVLKHIHGMDYLATRPGRDYSTVPCKHEWLEPDHEGVKQCAVCCQQRFA